ncbi:MAG: hypothetical protein CL904_01650 [Dehalococcoidia bacterium]|nr:hypothetical protein [Dehalococcoidia bacterium]
MVNKKRQLTTTTVLTLHQYLVKTQYYGKICGLVMKINLLTVAKNSIKLFDSFVFIFGLVSTGFAATSIFFWFSSFANNQESSTGSAFPYVLPIITLLVTGFAIKLSRNNKSNDHTYTLAAILALISTSGFLVISGLVPEFQHNKTGTDWDIFKWVILVGLYAGLITFWLSISLIMFKLSYINKMITNRKSNKSMIGNIDPENESR